VRRLYENLGAESQDDPELQHGLAKVLFRTGATNKAIAILEKLINPEDPKYHADLEEFYNTQAISHEKDPVKQLDLYRKSLAVRERLVRLRPDDPEAHRELSSSLNTQRRRSGRRPSGSHVPAPRQRG
jgi:tetratricopeptide (TPR) repeat protein